MLLPCDPAIMFLDFYPKELKIHVHTQTSTRMFIATLFTIVSRWKKLKYLSAGEWAEKWYVDIMEHYAAIKRNEPSSYEKNGIIHIIKLLSERSQSEKATFCVIPTM